MSSDTITYTLRLPPKSKTRLERIAEQKAISVNQLILEIIDSYYQAAGFMDSVKLKSKGGRVLEIRRATPERQIPGQPVCEFYLDDPKRNREVANYTIGLTQQVLDRLGVEEKDQYDVVEEIGAALLHYYASLDCDITKLSWNQFPRYPNRRVISMKDIGHTFINSPEKFLQALQFSKDIDPLANCNFDDSHLVDDRKHDDKKSLADTIFAAD